MIQISVARREVRAEMAARVATRGETVGRAATPRAVRNFRTFQARVATAETAATPEGAPVLAARGEPGIPMGTPGPTGSYTNGLRSHPWGRRVSGAVARAKHSASRRWLDGT